LSGFGGLCSLVGSGSGVGVGVGSTVASGDGDADGAGLGLGLGAAGEDSTGASVAGGGDGAVAVVVLPRSGAGERVVGVTDGAGAIVGASGDGAASGPVDVGSCPDASDIVAWVGSTASIISAPRASRAGSGAAGLGTAKASPRSAAATRPMPRPTAVCPPDECTASATGATSDFESHASRNGARRIAIQIATERCIVHARSRAVPAMRTTLGAAAAMSDASSDVDARPDL
jgi:hypothetical protein